MSIRDMGQAVMTNATKWVSTPGSALRDLQQAWHCKKLADVTWHGSVIRGPAFRSVAFFGSEYPAMAEEAGI